MKTNPFNNNVLVEVQRDFDGVSRSDDNESMKYGKLIDYHIDQCHLTASSGFELPQGYFKAKSTELKENIGKTVRWEEFAEGGQTFEEDGKTYALVPWWRLISVTEDK